MATQEERFGSGAMLPTCAAGALALALAITAEELLGYQTLPLLTPSGAGLGSYAALCMVQLICAAACFFGCDALTRACARRVWHTLGPTLTLLGGALAVAAPGSPTLLAGFALLAVGCLALKIAVLRLLSETSPVWGRRMVLAGVLLQSFCAPVFVLDGPALWGSACVCALAGFALTKLAGAPAASERQSSDQGLPRASTFRKPPHIRPAFIAGFFVMCTAVAYLNPLMLYPGLSQAGFVGMSFATHLVAALLFWLFTCVLHDSSYAFALKGVTTLLLVAYLLFALLGADAMPPRFLSATVLSTLENVTLLALAELAALSDTRPMRLFAGYYAIMRGCALAGIVMGEVDQRAFSIGAAYSVLGVALATLCVVAVVWLLTEKNLNELFWGGTLNEVAKDGEDAGTQVDALQAVVERRVGKLAQRFGLTEREHEVLGLVALGRSATFIAEELSISSNTVRKRVAQIYAKCGVHSKQELLTLVQKADCSE